MQVTRGAVDPADTGDLSDREKGGNPADAGDSRLDSHGSVSAKTFMGIPRHDKCIYLHQHFSSFSRIYTRKIVRPQLGLKLKTLDLLGMSRIEQLSRNFNISSGLVVREVSAESVAERHGIRVGDVILSCQGESVSSIAQFEDILLRVG